jgi:uncharacterized Zn finger protein (UPF0148 family)
MPACPECQTELTDDFGIVDCKSCGAVCSIDLEDNVTIQGEDVAAASNEPVEEDLSEVESSEDTWEASADEVDQEEDEEVYEVRVDEPISEVEEETESETEVYEAVEEKSIVEQAVAAVPMSGADFLKDLEIFTEEAGAEGVGHIYYDLHVKGFEDSKLRELFIESLADERLEIDEDSLRDAVGAESEFTLPQISFLRLTVIYKRLVTLGLDMSWTLSEDQEALEVESGSYEETEEVYEDEY